MNNNSEDKLPIKEFLFRHVPDQVSNSRRVCYRHHPDLIKQRQPDDLNIKNIQHQLEELPTEDKAAITQIWSIFSAAPADQRILILKGLLSTCCMPQLSFLYDAIKPLLRIDFLTILPREISLQIFFYLDAKSLCHAAQVSRNWKRLADDDALWHRMCEQHIDKKCTKCGWGLPLLNKKRKATLRIERPLINTSNAPLRIACGSTVRNDTTENITNSMDHVNKKSKIDKEAISNFDIMFKSGPDLCTTTSAATSTSASTSTTTIAPTLVRKAWKDVYSERLMIERNWRNNNYKLTVLSGHTDGVMCVQFCDAINILMTGSYDKTVRIWNLESGELIRTLTGHTRCVRALQFDEAKLVTASMDHTLKIWNWQTGKCIRTLEGHTGGVLSLHFNSKLMASGSTDHTVRVWNFSAGECCTFTGHTEWVNSVRFCQEGTMLVSASDDSTIRLWDVQTRSCIRVLNGHVGQVQIAIPSLTGFTHRLNEEDVYLQPQNNYSSNTNLTQLRPACATTGSNRRNSMAIKKESKTPLTNTAILSRDPIIISGSLDNTIKLWDMKTGKCIRTLFGHIEGVWSLAYDTLRIISGSHDKTVRVWDLGSGKCMHALEGHRGPVTAVALGDTKIVSTSDDGDIRVWDYGV
ncbi:quinon protein alcohol dehydrogenase-like superfamily [Cokeromyces recurvatus]|uniref:quinon protein alcohol dehydrogenase-like superfamily n=1 Tax=Cokeromyces recurvatus TaxID=90255 RepID=UPI00221EC5C6|nr:quinon protein alcohol dehydrogenase-like superfamily [Cokeromyces recurvatus]KAI7907669.1 quinon protein alcohol dehydrogenase-like superfamily [Cokeromyces recurvatus]